MIPKQQREHQVIEATPWLAIYLIYQILARKEGRIRLSCPQRD